MALDPDRRIPSGEIKLDPIAPSAYAPPLCPLVKKPQTPVSLTRRAKTSIRSLLPSPLSLSLSLSLHGPRPQPLPFLNPPGDFPFLSSVFPENSPPKPVAGLSLELEAPPPPPPPLDKNGFFYQLLHSPNTDHRVHDFYFTGEASSSNPFAGVASAPPQLDQPFRHPTPDAYLTAMLPIGFDLHVPPPPLAPSPPPFVDLSTERDDDRDGIAAHGELEFESLFIYSPLSPPVDHHRHNNPVMADPQIMPSLDLNDLGSLNARPGENVSSGSVTSDRKWGHERDDGSNDRSKRMVDIKVDKKHSVVKGQWTDKEDRALTRLVQMHGTKNWSFIAKMLDGRVGKQCRERWNNHLRPDIKKDSWTIEEDQILIQSHMEIGNRWAEIAKRLFGRTENTIKNHWNAIKRRQYCKRKLLPDTNSSELLQSYIRSVTTPSPPKRSTPARRRNLGDRHHHKTKKRSMSLSAAAIFCGSDVQPEAANHPRQVPKPHHHHQPPPAENLANGILGFPMADGNENLGLHPVKDCQHSHHVLSEGGGSKESDCNDHELDLKISLEIGNHHHHRRHHRPNHRHHQEEEELDWLEMTASQVADSELIKAPSSW
ncbi:uncharacterized protein LOC125315961 [Rhodamnia argentea]|uniref:Uncharacterized protein LOC125315961 n=1 Tax=Rhodamnia argentea TaxID=178133 RepID=A0ABM3HPM4_9MYRT|nr:uncharacterized protein LOC125315961 [Rhodamnia argentea]